MDGDLDLDHFLKQINLSGSHFYVDDASLRMDFESSHHGVPDLSTENHGKEASGGSGLGTSLPKLAIEKTKTAVESIMSSNQSRFRQTRFNYKGVYPG